MKNRMKVVEVGFTVVLAVAPAAHDALLSPVWLLCESALTTTNAPYIKSLTKPEFHIDVQVLSGPEPSFNVPIITGGRVAGVQPSNLKMQQQTQERQFFAARFVKSRREDGKLLLPTHPRAARRVRLGSTLLSLS